MSPRLSPTGAAEASPSASAEPASALLASAASPEPVTSTSLPLPPSWAARSIAEDGGVTHEWVSPVQPLAQVAPCGLRPIEVSVSVRDGWHEERWVRSSPRIQVEGGSLPVEQARVLQAALGEVLARLGTDDRS